MSDEKDEKSKLKSGETRDGEKPNPDSAPTGPADGTVPPSDSKDSCTIDDYLYIDRPFGEND